MHHGRTRRRPSSKASRASPAGAATRNPLLDQAVEVPGTDPEAPGAQGDDRERPRLPEPPDVADGHVEALGDLAEGQEAVGGGGIGHRGPLGGREVRYGGGSGHFED